MANESSNPVPTEAIRRILFKMAVDKQQRETGPTGRLPLPSNDPVSRQRYAQAFKSRYGDVLQGMGDTPLRYNERPAFSNKTSKELAQSVAGKHGVDPALLYTLAMDEGMSGIYPGEKNLEYKLGPDKEYPLSAQWTFGLDSFLNKYKDLVAQGKLPSDFSTRFKSITDPMKATNYAYFKTPEDGLMAASAMWKGHYEDVDKYAKSKGIKLSPRARDFIAMVGFNAGEGTAHQMMEDYRKNKVLENDAFMKKRPTSGIGLSDRSYADTYDVASRRLAMSDALKKEGYFEEPANLKVLFKTQSK